ncbi:MATE family Na+-driven efflux transporter [Brachyspira hyodysenteriae]|uniref:Na+-driven multidrug efflux pump n=1 Tax=Brachyspira hyodysenteriae (strain ATCC 49526 / WA1) TaxID=565034 RepID=A0A3B6VHX8_BRAHW|nr:MATE family Na+-driven efflux transporter [Brachyspira hyodysenteriae]ACN84884.1 putative Na+-driven multidrug efflux pump [Brachyspira hyodysenteriae WA1]AUJ50607.1 multidrug transporter [Brachyspira hyodysenteriae]KLI42857.1 multidrug transporter [Brachyspira hyodysenteriae]KLI47051.1 multidrug transporter [Brachyspira hyodysenteriae]KLI51087.1 multidrug transporter [Brachyspira hyodysenteriae]
MGTNLLKQINFRLFIVLMIQALMPSIYSTFRIYLLDSYPSASGINIASQQMWLGIIYEVFEEAIIAPLFFFFGKIKDKNSDEEKYIFINKVRSSILIITFIYIVMAFIINVFAGNLVTVMKQQTELYLQTTTYIRLESLANIAVVLFHLVIIVHTALENYKSIFVITTIKMFLTIILDIVFVSQYSISLNLGVNGIAYNNIISNLISVIIALVLLNKSGYNIFDKIKLQFLWNKKVSSLNVISGLESFYRNLIYSIVLVRMINIVGEQGNYWVANSFYWAWLLIPINQIGTLVRTDLSKDHNRSLKPYVLLTTICVLIWIALIPTYKYFMKYIMNAQNLESVMSLIMILFPFYIFYAYYNIISNLLYAIGQIKYMLLQSFIVNTFFNIPYFILYLKGVYEITLLNITLRFGLAILISTVIIYIIYFAKIRKILKLEKHNI